MTPLALQQELAALGYYRGALDGLQGPATITAIRAAQSGAGQTPDGVVSPALLAYLDVKLHTIEGIPSTCSPAAATCVQAWEGLGDGNPKTVLLEPYEDPVLIWTLGWGHALVDSAGRFIRSAYRGDPTARAKAVAAVTKLFGAPAISVEQAKSLLSVDLNDFVAQVAPMLAGAPCTQAEFDALISFAFNVGAKTLDASSLLARHKTGVMVAANLDFKALAAQSRAHSVGTGIEGAFGAYSFSGGAWLEGLFRRRMCEAMIYRGDAVGVAIAAARSIS